ncbi:MAG: head maturation protease, ClpP-related [Hyphomicrobium sp.]|jgi:ATP-dependent protease ClpP protease subunit
MSAENRHEKRDWFRIEAKAGGEDELSSADVHIYDEIGERWYGGGVGARSFAEQIDALDVHQINLHINSPGGAAWDGITIMNALRRHKARVEVTVDGLAASAASVIAMAGDRVVMNRGAQMMIHDASGGAWGPAETMTETAEILNKLSDSIADIYAARGGKDRAHWRELMKAESWYTAEEAVTAGLADEWADAPTAENSVDPRTFYNLSMVASARKRSPVAVDLNLPSPTGPGELNRKEGVVAYDDLKNGLRSRLGVTAADATDEALLEALDATLAAEPAVAVLDAAALPEGVQMIDSAVLADLQAQAAQGVAARAEQDTQRRDGMVRAALSDGRIAPASADTWRAQLDTNEEGTAALLASLPSNKIPVSEIGGATVEDSADAAIEAWATGETKGA